VNLPHETVMVRGVVRLLTPLIQLYALYVIFHGHYSPGGGFQGGVVLAGSYILIGLGLGLEELERRVSEHTLAVMSGVGVAIFGLVGLISLLSGSEYLDYAALGWLADEVPMRRAYGILLVEIGVALTVAAGILLIFMRLVDSRDEGRDEGREVGRDGGRAGGEGGLT
jgi:multicomponent Na+:H+ antiporter subunit B